MDRRVTIVAVAVIALLSTGGCQGYNFNPVGHCLIQTGTKRVTLSTVSTADVLFVVDDSGSMAGKQAALANNFGTFVAVLDQANADRVAAGLVPIDFHIAITTTSNFIDWTVQSGSTCRNDCQGASGAVCCLAASNRPQPPQCKVDSDCRAGFICTNACGPSNGGNALEWPVGGGDKSCYSDATNCNPQPIACSTLGSTCGVAEKFYDVGACSLPSGWTTPTMFTPDGEYAMGRFIAQPGNPLVLNFTKPMYCNWNAATGKCDAGAGTGTGNLPTQFGQNVAVGTCGSGQEQGLEGARLAIQRALGANGLAQTTGYLGDFLHPNAKLVVAWVSDENDCSSPRSEAYGVPFPPTSTTPSADGCYQDSLLPEAQQRQYHIADYTKFFTSLGRPFGAAFIVSATTSAGSNACQDETCQAAICTDSTCTSGPLVCGGQYYPYRYMTLASQLRAQGADVVVGSICDSFGTTLGRIAQIVKPPLGLTLPAQPAASDVTILRIALPDGNTRKTCFGPPAPMTAAAAAALGYDWWFTATADQVTDAQKAAVGPTRFVYINHATGNCEANPGETYSVDYIGQLPAGGCATSMDCYNALGGTLDSTGQPADWTCYAGESGTQCVPPTTTARGSCVCGSFAHTCPNNPIASAW